MEGNNDFLAGIKQLKVSLSLSLETVETRDCVVTTRKRVSSLEYLAPNYSKGANVVVTRRVPGHNKYTQTLVITGAMVAEIMANNNELVALDDVIQALGGADVVAAVWDDCSDSVILATRTALLRLTCTNEVVRMVPDSTFEGVSALAASNAGTVFVLDSGGARLHMVNTTGHDAVVTALPHPMSKTESEDDKSCRHLAYMCRPGQPGQLWTTVKNRMLVAFEPQTGEIVSSFPPPDRTTEPRLPEITALEACSNNTDIIIAWRGYAYKYTTGMVYECEHDTWDALSVMPGDDKLLCYSRSRGCNPALVLHLIALSRLLGSGPAQELPAQAQELPAQAQELPAQAQELPAQAQELPAQAQELPAQPSQPLPPLIIQPRGDGTLVDDLLQLMLLPKGTRFAPDVRVIIGDCSVLAHSLILAARSPFFARAILAQAGATTGLVEVVVPPEPVSVAAFQVIANYMYTDELQMMTTTMHLQCQVITAAKFLGMARLASKIEEGWQNALSVDIVLETLRVCTSSDRCASSAITQLAVDYLLANLHATVDKHGEEAIISTLIEVCAGGPFMLEGLLTRLLKELKGLTR